MFSYRPSRLRNSCTERYSSELNSEELPNLCIEGITCTQTLDVQSLEFEPEDELKTIWKMNS